MRKLAVVQCIPSDLHASKDPLDYCISALKESGVVDSIVLVVPLIEGANTIFDELGKKWDVDVYYGSTYNIVERICNAAEKYNPDIVVRCLLRRFYLDTNLVKSMINKINEGYDYIELSNDVNLDVAADVSTFKALQKTSQLLKDLPNDYLSNSYRFNPWVFMSGSKQFHTFTMKYPILWDKERVKEIKQRLTAITESHEDTESIDEKDPTSRYIFYSKWIEKNDTLLDIACGEGGGTYVLSKYAKKAIGIDYNQEYIEKAKNRFNKKNLQFIHGTDESLDNFEDKFDKVVCAHTMEHIEDDEMFIRRIRKCLKAGGKLLLEVPRLAYYPLGEPLWPYHKREYSIDSLEKLLEDNSFAIEEAYGGKRHTYVDVKDAVESLFYVCKKL